MQGSTSHPRLKFFPLPPMLPKSQNKNIQHQEIIITPEPAQRVELVLQPPGLQTQNLAPTPHSRDKPSTSPSLDPHSNPWIKIFKNIRKHPRFSKPENHRRHPEKFNTNYYGTRKTLEKSAPKHHINFLRIIYSKYPIFTTSTIIRGVGNYGQFINGKR